MGRIHQKGKAGAAKAYITRSSAVKKLQCSLADFRRLCILKGKSDQSFSWLCKFTDRVTQESFQENPKTRGKPTRVLLRPHLSIMPRTLLILHMSQCLKDCVNTKHSPKNFQERWGAENGVAQRALKIINRFIG